MNVKIFGHKLLSSMILGAALLAGICVHADDNWYVNLPQNFFNAGNVVNNAVDPQNSNSGAVIVSNGAGSMDVYVCQNGNWGTGSWMHFTCIDDNQSISATWNSDGTCKTLILNYDGYSKTLYSLDGQWLNSNDLTVSYVSAYPNDSTKAIYSVTIPPENINNAFSSLFNDGENGYWYDVSVTDAKGNESDFSEYPVTYKQIGTDSNNLMTNAPLTFEIEAPKYNGTGEQPTISVTEYCYNQNSSPVQQTIVRSFPSYGLPVAAPAPAESNYSISVSPINYAATSGTIVNLNNGVCAVPFLVQISDANSNVIPGYNDIYNHLAFDYQASANAKHQIIGSNPFKGVSYGGYAILPEYSVEDSSGNVKYGLSGKEMSNTYGGGRVYYLFCGPEAVNGGKINISLYEDDGTAGGSGTESMSVAIIEISTNPPICNIATVQNGMFQTITLTGPAFNGDSTYPASNTLSSLGKGYIMPDYMYSEVNGHGAIYLVPNEGLSTNMLEARFNWSKLAIGYNFDACNFYGIPESNSLNSEGFEWQNLAKVTLDDAQTFHQTQTMSCPITSMCDATKGKPLYAYLFSAYGTLHPYLLNDTDALNGRSPMTYSYSVTNSANMPMYYTGSNNSDSFAPNNHFGIFVPAGLTLSGLQESYTEAVTANPYTWADNTQS